MVTPNERDRAIQTVLNAIQESADNESLEKMYSMTLGFFKKQKGKEMVWFDFAMKLCKSYLNSKKNEQCEKLLDELHASCKVNGEDDANKGGQLLEIYSIKIQLMAAANNRVALAELFERTNQLIADVNDPRSMSVIKECWGKMYASMNQWDEAYTNFYDAVECTHRLPPLLECAFSPLLVCSPCSVVLLSSVRTKTSGIRM